MNEYLQLFEGGEESNGSKAEASPLLDLFTIPAPLACNPPPRIVSCAQTPDENSFYFCQRNIPLHYSTHHMLVVGTSGSGKTATIARPLIQSISPRFQIAREIPEQLVIFDAKGDAVPFCASLGYLPEHANVWLLNPFDDRAVVWEVAQAVQEPARAWQLATMIVPVEEKSTAPFFSEGARLLAFADILGLNAKFGTNWTLADLLCALDSRENIALVASAHPEANVIAQSVLRDQKHSPGVVASLATKIRKFSQVAALWASNPSARKFSIPEFLKHPGILILGHDPVLKDSLLPLYGLLLRALTDEILSGAETLHPKVWCILDEYLALARYDESKAIIDLLELGRSKGAAVMLGIQSVAGMIDVYGEAGMNRILGLCAHKMFLRVGDPQTAEWAERYFGKVRKTEMAYSESWNKEGVTQSFNFSVQDRSLFLAAAFMDIPFPAFGRPACAICDVPSSNVVILSSRSFDEILSWNRPAVDIEPLKRRTNPVHQMLLPWTEQKLQRFREGNALDAGEATPKPPPQTYLPKRTKPKDPNQPELL